MQVPVLADWIQVEFVFEKGLRKKEGSFVIHMGGSRFIATATAPDIFFIGVPGKSITPKFCS
jgi:hypothetical protein